VAWEVAVPRGLWLYGGLPKDLNDLHVTPREIKYENACQGLWQSLYYKMGGLEEINLEKKFDSELIMGYLKNISITKVSSPQ
jgi:hypothetical protein